MALLAAMAAAGSVAAQQIPTPAPLQAGETLLQVSAQGIARAVPDVAELSTEATSDGATAKAALAANAAKADRLISALRDAGVPDQAIRTEAVGVRPRYKPDKDGDDSDEVIGYRAINRVKVRLADVMLASRVVDAWGSAGSIRIDGPAFSFADDTAIKASARAMAVKAAQAQAADYAAPFGLKIARVLRISERAVASESGQDIVVTARKLSGAPILPGEQEVAVTLWVDYALTR